MRGCTILASLSMSRAACSIPERPLMSVSVFIDSQLLSDGPLHDSRLTLVPLGRLDAQDVGQRFGQVKLPLHLVPSFVPGHQAATSILATVPSAAIIRS